jgi:excisionase family DNA binding protein
MRPKPPSADRSRREGNQTGSRASLLTAGVESDSAEKNYTVKQVAELLSISAQAVYQLCTKKLLRHLRLGTGRGTLRIPESALGEFVTRSTVEADAPAEPKAPPARLKHLKR